MYQGLIGPFKTIRPNVLLLLIILLAAGLLLQACSSTPDELSAGDEAPYFSLPSSSGTEVALSDYIGEQPVLLFFHMAVG